MEKKGFFCHGFLLEGLLGLEGRCVLRGRAPEAPQKVERCWGVPVAAWLAGAMAASAQQAAW